MVFCAHSEYETNKECVAFHALMFHDVIKLQIKNNK